jgi:hypothetical protein
MVDWPAGYLPRSLEMLSLGLDVHHAGEADQLTLAELRAIAKVVQLRWPLRV